LIPEDDEKNGGAILFIRPAPMKKVFLNSLLTKKRGFFRYFRSG